MLDTLFWTLVGFLLGAIPFSLLMGKLLTRKDIRSVGDGNPGGANAIKAGGLKAGIPAILLDIGKGYLPVFLAQKAGLSDRIPHSDLPRTDPWACFLSVPSISGEARLWDRLAEYGSGWLVCGHFRSLGPLLFPLPSYNRKMPGRPMLE